MSGGRLITIAGFTAVAILRISFASYALAADSSTRHGMWARVSVMPKRQFPNLTAAERTNCVQQ
jgi:hypothetical protein